MELVWRALTSDEPQRYWIALAVCAFATASLGSRAWFFKRWIRSPGLFWPRSGIADLDIWRSAMVMVKRYGDDATLEAAARADELMERGDMVGCTTWRIERLQAKAPAEGETTH